MRIGLDLRRLPRDEQLLRAREADEYGLWAVLTAGPPGTELTSATYLATHTSNIHIGVWLAMTEEPALTYAEDIAVLDLLSRRRALAVIDADDAKVAHIERLLRGEIVDGVALAPPPAQTAVPVWRAGSLPTAALSGDLDRDRTVIDHHRDTGCTHLFVTWPGPVKRLARHLVSRAATPDFPQFVADQADLIDP
jgi:hypothetical protein